MSWQCAAPLHPISLYLVSTLYTIVWYQITPSKGHHWVEVAKALWEQKVNVCKGKDRPTALQYFTHVAIIYYTWIGISAAIPPSQVRVCYPCEVGGSFFLLVNLFLLEETGWKRKLKCYGNTHSISSWKHILFGNQDLWSHTTRMGREEKYKHSKLRLKDSGAPHLSFAYFLSQWILAVRDTASRHWLRTFTECYRKASLLAGDSAQS